MKRFFILLIAGLLFSQVQNAQYEELVESYDLLTTIAGKGDTDGRDNDWLPEYEGQPATTVELSRPHMAMADAAGNIYIADKGGHGIRRIDTDGILTTVAGTSIAGDGEDGLATEQALSSPNGVWVKSDGSFYILDLNNDKIRKVDTEGNMITIVDDQGGISLGRGLWVNENEDTIWYSSGSQVKCWTEAGGIITYASGFSGLGNIVQDHQGKLIATDRTGKKVYRINASGEKIHIAGNGNTSGGGDGFTALETAFDGVRGVWFLEDGSYFLATHEGSQVWFIDLEGIAHLFLNGREGDSNHSGDGEHFQTSGYKISEVRAISLDYEGNMLVTENDRGFIRRINRKTLSGFINASQKDDTELNVFPNPAKETFNVNYMARTGGNIIIKVVGTDGKILQTYKLRGQTGDNLFSLSRESLPQGLYHLIVYDHNRVLNSSLLLAD